MVWLSAHEIVGETSDHKNNFKKCTGVTAYKMWHKLTFFMRLWDDADHDHDNEGNDDNCEDEKTIWRQRHRVLI